MPEPARPPRVIRFGLFEADLAAGELRKNGLKVKLQDRPFEILSILLEHPDEVISREEFRRRLWPADTFVDFDHSLNASINKLRQALDDLADNPRFVATVGRRGYRFIAPVGGPGQHAEPAATAVAEEKPPVASTPEMATGVLPFRAAREGATKPGMRARSQTLVAAAGVFAALIAGYTGLRWYAARTNPAAPVTDKPSIAVLPLKNLSGDPANDYFCDGITEEISNKLSRIQHLRVAAYSSAARFKGAQKGAKEIGQDLQVRYLMEGSVRRAGDQVRVSSQVIDTATGFQLWADDFTGNLKDIFALQEQTALKIAQALDLKLSAQEKQALQRRYTQNAQAYDAYIIGRGLSQQGVNSPDKLEAARRHFEQALKLDPDYAPALAGLSSVEYFYYRNIDSKPDHLERAGRLAQRAVAAAPDLAYAQIALGQVYGAKYDYAKAVEVLREAVRLDPEDSRAWDQLSWALAYQQPPQAVEAEKDAREAIRLEPSFAPTYYHLGRAQLLQGRYEDARRAFERAGELGNARFRDLGVAQVDLAQGNYDPAIALLKNREPKAVIPAYLLSCVYAAKGEKEKALAALETTLKLGYRDFAAIDASPYFASLRSDPKYKELLQRYRK